MKTFSNAGGGTNTDGSYSFTIPDGITYMKYYVTGSGANGGMNSGGAAAAVIGNISAGPSSEFTVYVAAGPDGDNQDGNGSCIMVGGNIIAASCGGCSHNVASTEINRGTPGPGFLGTTEPQFLNGYIFVGGCGGMDTDGTGIMPGGEESGGAASYWGSYPTPGAGSGGHAGNQVGHAGDGFVMFEWN